MTYSYQLTPAEHELMEILWSIKQGTVRDVMAELPAKRNLAYTSVSTILRILQQKKIVAAEKIGKQHIYKPILTKEVYAAHSVKKIVKHVFSGSSVELVAHLVDKHKVSLEEIKALQALLAKKKRELT